MCTIAILIEVVDGAPLVLAANRDELYARPTRAPQVLEHTARGVVVGGLDELSGGTWLALRTDGAFAAVTNQRALATPPPGLRSRGLVVRELAAAADPDAYVSAIDPSQYASMNLVYRTGGGDIAIAYVRREPATLEIGRLGPGIHVLCNDRLGAPGFPRGERLAAELARVASRGWPQVVPALHAGLGDHARSAPSATPPSELPLSIAHALTATCIHTDAYGTRSATIAAVGDRGLLAHLHADGPPCTTPFMDLRGLYERT